MGWMDRLFGTDATFKNTINDVRHRNLFGLKSARERYPDNDNKNEVTKGVMKKVE